MPAQTATKALDSKLLQRALQANGVFSGISGITITVGSGFVAKLLGTDATSVINLLGTMLFVFSVWLFFISARQPISYQLALAVVVLDIFCVGGSAVILLSDWLPLTTAGKWLIAAIAAIVATFAVVQTYGLGQLRGASRVLDTA